MFAIAIAADIAWTLGLATLKMTSYIWRGVYGEARNVLFYCFCQQRCGRRGKRIALLIGNQGYGSEIGPLTNPHGYSRKLRAAGSDAVGFF